jgi:hypothetical protein
VVNVFPITDACTIPMIFLRQEVSRLRVSFSCDEKCSLFR